MFTPLLNSSIVKAVSATALSLAAIVSIFDGQSGIAQVVEETGTPNENFILPTDGDFRPPSNPSRRGGYLTTTGTRAFTPPSNPRRRSGHRTTTGTRQGSCVGDSETAFTVLGPSETLGQTTSARPEFVWYLPPSETVYPVQFRLLAPNAQGIPAPIHTAELNYTGGFMHYQLPAEVAALSPNIEYRWQVVVVCDENYLSRSLNQERAFEVITLSASLQQSLAAATTEAERAVVYGEAGIWYDAIAQVAQPSNSQSATVRQNLIEDLAAIEAEDEQLSKDLAAIADTAD